MDDDCAKRYVRNILVNWQILFGAFLIGYYTMLGDKNTTKFLILDK